MLDGLDLERLARRKSDDMRRFLFVSCAPSSSVGAVMTSFSGVGVTSGSSDGSREELVAYITYQHISFQ